MNNAAINHTVTKSKRVRMQSLRTDTCQLKSDLRPLLNARERIAISSRLLELIRVKTQMQKQCVLQRRTVLPLSSSSLLSIALRSSPFSDGDLPPSTPSIYGTRLQFRTRFDTNKL